MTPQPVSYVCPLAWAELGLLGIQSNLEFDLFVYLTDMNYIETLADVFWLRQSQWGLAHSNRPHQNGQHGFQSRQRSIRSQRVVQEAFEDHTWVV